MPFLNLNKKARTIGAVSLAASLVAGGLTTALLTSTSALAQVSVENVTPLSFADLVDAVSPAVVSISVEGTQQVRNPGGRNFEFNFPDLPEDHPLKDFFENFPGPFGNQMPDGPRTRPFRGAGSGFIISEDGFVVTNNHVVENGDTVSVVMNDGTEYPAQVIGLDPRTDLALLKIDNVSGLTYVEFADAEARVGDWVVAVGNPFGLGGSVTAGIISARGRDITANSYGDYIQIDAAINRGNSGGPAFNLSGQVIGVNTAIFSPNGGNVGIAFAIPASTVEQVITDLMDDGAVTRGYLGVNLQDLNQSLADSIGLGDAKGAMVTRVSPDSPAAAVGIEPGDVILSVSGDPIDDTIDLVRTISRNDPGTIVDIEVFRDGAILHFDATLATLNEAAIAQISTPVPPAPIPDPMEGLGLTVTANPNGDGVVIEEVDPASSAAEEGLRPGDVIVEAADLPVNTPDELAAALADAQSAGKSSLFIKTERNGDIRFLGLNLSNE